MDHTQLRRKPTGPLPGVVSKGCSTNCVKVHIHELIADICSGMTYCPAVFSGGERRMKNWVQQQVIVLDFDGGVTFEEFLRTSNRSHMFPVAVYETFSSTPDVERFHAVYVLEEPSTEPQVVLQMMDYLIQIHTDEFGRGPDKGSRSLCKIYYGTNKNVLWTSYESRISSRRVYAAPSIEDDCGWDCCVPDYLDMLA